MLLLDIPVSYNDTSKSPIVPDHKGIRRIKIIDEKVLGK